MTSEDLIYIDKDISVAKTMPSLFYTDNDYYDKTLKKIFNYSWQFVNDKKMIDKYKIIPFSFLSDSINEPLILTNNKNIQCFSNVCTHRANILCSYPSNKKTIQCGYHGKTFDLCGKFKFMPGFEDAKNFPSETDNLKKANIKEWNEFIFCSLNLGIDIDNVLDDINNRLKNFPFDELIFDNKKSSEYIINAHWATYCENYLEGFHVPYVHNGLNNDIDIDTYETIILKNGVLQQTKSKDLNNKIYAYYYWIFPNMMFNFYDWGLSINIIEPMGINKTKIKFLSYPKNGYHQEEGKDSSIDKVEAEDQSIVTQVNKGLKSQYYKHGRYSPKYEKGVHYFHQLLAKYIK